MASTSSFTCVLNIRADLGECPLWSLTDQALYWVDINAPTLNRFDPVSRANEIMPMPEAIGCYAFRKSGGFLVALRSALWFADAQGRLVDRIARAPYDVGSHRFNDGRCDRQGRFWVGSINEKRDASSAALYALAADSTLVRAMDGMMVSNGLAWSPDGRTMYHADTPTQTVHRFDYDTATGTPSNRRPFVRFTNEGERPDGACVDAEGCYWSAFYRGGKVVRIAPDGRVLAEFLVPAMCPTMCALGGPDLRTLFVTSARQRRTDEELARLPLSGGIFAMRVDVPGLPEPRFAG